MPKNKKKGDDDQAVEEPKIKRTSVGNEDQMKKEAARHQHVEGPPDLPPTCTPAQTQCQNDATIEMNFSGDRNNIRINNLTERRQNDATIMMNSIGDHNVIYMNCPMVLNYNPDPESRPARTEQMAAIQPPPSITDDPAYPPGYQHQPPFALQNAPSGYPPQGAYPPQGRYPPQGEDSPHAGFPSTSEHDENQSMPAFIKVCFKEKEIYKIRRQEHKLKKTIRQQEKLEEHIINQIVKVYKKQQNQH